MNIHVVTTAYNLPEATKELVSSLSIAQARYRHQRPEDRITVHLFQNSLFPEVQAVCEALAHTLPEMVRHYHYQKNHLAWAWNEGIVAAYEEGADVVLIVNDDVVFHGDSVYRLAEAALDQPERPIVTCRGDHARWGPSTEIGYSVFAYNRSAFDRVGMFDANYFPIYAEDEDYRWRVKLAGLTEGTAGLLDLRHGGSAHLVEGLHVEAIRRRNARTQYLNHAWHYAKWGGNPGQEVYQRPFNDERFDLRIAPEDRHAPYPGYDRGDFETVVTI